MIVLQNLIKRIDGIYDQIIDAIKKALRENEAFIVEMVTEDQLYERGIDGTGASIGAYQPYTIDRKRDKGQKFSNVTLQDTGDFHDSFRILLETERFRIYATDDKADTLVENWGKDIFALTDENLQDVIDSYLKPEVHKTIKNEIRKFK